MKRLHKELKDRGHDELEVNELIGGRLYTGVCLRLITHRVDHHVTATQPPERKHRRHMTTT